jgi:hypothetical protein
VKPKGGFVPDAATAIKIAVAVWTPIYGARRIEAEKPFRAQLRDGVWTVEGFMPPNPSGEPMFGRGRTRRNSQERRKNTSRVS